MLLKVNEESVKADLFLIDLYPEEGISPSKYTIVTNVEDLTRTLRPWPTTAYVYACLVNSTGLKYVVKYIYEVANKKRKLTIVKRY